MAVSVAHLRFWFLRKFVRIFSQLGHQDNWLSRGLYGIIRWFWEFISPSKVFHIVSFAEYLSNHSGTATSLRTNRQGYAANAVSIGRGERQILKAIKLPDLNLYCIEDVSVHHGSDFIVNIKERLVVNDYCVTKNDENQGYEDQWCYWQEGREAIVRFSENKRHLKAGIMLLDKYSFNYYHNMYDNLIRLCVLEEHNKQIPANIPIVVDEDVFRVASFKRIFEIMNEKIKRPTEIIKKGDLVYVDKLYYITQVNRLVPNHKDYLKGKINDYIFDKEYTLKLRKILLDYKEEALDSPRRVFITRKRTKHRHFNEDVLFEELKPYGFVKIVPEDYTFEQQMAIFNNAEWIIGGPGAALTNLLFVSPLCIVICLYRNSAYIPAVFTAPVCFNGAKMYYFQSSKGESILKAHTDFTINQEDFSQFVNDCIYPLIQVNKV